MRARRVGWGVLLATAMLLAPGERAQSAPPPKETPAEWVAKVTAALEKGTMQDVANLFGSKHPITVDELAMDLDVAARLVRGIYTDAPRRAFESLQMARELVTVAGEVAKAMVFKAPADPRCRRATALARAAKGSLLAVRGEAPEFPAWLVAADLAAQSYDSPEGAKDGGEFAAMAIGWMRTAAALPGADAAVIGAKADALGAVLAGLPAGPFPTAGNAVLKMIALDATLRATPSPAPATLKAPLEEVLAILAPGAKPGGDLAAATLWQECVTIARSRKVPSMKVDYVLRPPAPQLNVTWQVPLSSQWHDVPVEPGDATFTGSFEQRMEDGRVTHRIEVRTFRWDKRYPIGQSLPMKGDSPKELALALREVQRKLFGSITSEKDLTKGTMSDGMGPGQMYEIEGTSNANGEPLAIRGYVVRGRETKGTFFITATTNGKPPPGDPELDVVIKSFREIKVPK